MRSYPLPGGNGTGIAYALGAIWVGNHAWNTYSKISMDGKVLGSWRLPGTDSRGMTFDGTYLWNTDIDRKAAYSFLPGTSTLVDSFSLPDPLNLYGLAWDGDRGCFWHTGTRSKVYRISSAGDVLSSFDLGRPICGVFYESPDILWITTYSHYGLTLEWGLAKVRIDGTILAEFPFEEAQFPNLRQAAGIEKIGDEFWFTDQVADKIWVARIEQGPWQVEIDVVPGDDANLIVVGETDLLPVAILSSLELPASLLDVTSIELGDPVLSGSCGPMATETIDVDGDGLEDLVAYFDVVLMALRNAISAETTVLSIRAEDVGKRPVHGEDVVAVSVLPWKQWPLGKRLHEWTGDGWSPVVAEINRGEVVVLTHGWAMGLRGWVRQREADGDIFPQVWEATGEDANWFFYSFQEIAKHIKTRDTDGQSRILAYSWIDSSASDNVFGVFSSRRMADTHGLGMADAVDSVLGTAFGSSGGIIHMIGHSHGCLVATVAAKELERRGRDVTQVTLLDSPELLTGISLPLDLPLALASNRLVWQFWEIHRGWPFPSIEVWTERFYVDNYFSLVGRPYTAPWGHLDAINTELDARNSEDFRDEWLAVHGFTPDTLHGLLGDESGEWLSYFMTAHGYPLEWYRKAVGPNGKNTPSPAGRKPDGVWFAGIPVGRGLNQLQTRTLQDPPDPRYSSRYVQENPETDMYLYSQNYRMDGAVAYVRDLLLEILRTDGLVDITGSTALLTESSPASFDAMIQIPGDGVALIFEYEFHDPGDGDSLCVWIDNTPVFRVLGVASGLGKRSHCVDLAGFGAGSHVLTVGLSSLGEPNAMLEVSGFCVVSAVRDHAPIAEAGPDLILECEGPWGTKIMLDGSGSSDPDGAISELIYTWYRDGSELAQGCFAMVTVPLGESMVTLVARDSSGGRASDTMTVTVQDTIPPSFHGLIATPSVLGPPNHKMVDVTLSATLTDIADPAPLWRIMSVTSNEPADGKGYGKTEPDWVITGDHTVKLRAERAGRGDGRVYTITVEATDFSGNAATAEVKVSVEHDQRRVPAK